MLHSAGHAYEQGLPSRGIKDGMHVVDLDLIRQMFGCFSSHIIAESKKSGFFNFFTETKFYLLTMSLPCK